MNELTDFFSQGCGCVLLLFLFVIPVAFLILLLVVFGVLIPLISLG